jgi:heme/copper-type cytochrome/quinol oxidase subunit 4
VIYVLCLAITFKYIGVKYNNNNMFFTLVSRTIITKINTPRDYLYIFLIGCVGYVILHWYLHMNKKEGMMEKIRQYMYYAMVADLVVAYTLMMIYPVKSNKKQSDDNESKEPREHTTYTPEQRKILMARMQESKRQQQMRQKESDPEINNNTNNRSSEQFNNNGNNDDKDNTVHVKKITTTPCLVGGDRATPCLAGGDRATPCLAGGDRATPGSNSVVKGSDNTNGKYDDRSNNKSAGQRRDVEKDLNNEGEQTSIFSKSDDSSNDSHGSQKSNKSQKNGLCKNEQDEHDEQDEQDVEDTEIPMFKKSERNKETKKETKKEIKKHGKK